MSTHIYFLPYNIHYLHISAHLMFNVYIYTYLPFILSTHLDLHTSTIFHSYPYLPLISHIFTSSSILWCTWTPLLVSRCKFQLDGESWEYQDDEVIMSPQQIYRVPNRIVNINTSCEFSRFLGTLCPGLRGAVSCGEIRGQIDFMEIFYSPPVRNVFIHVYL